MAIPSHNELMQTQLAVWIPSEISPPDSAFSLLTPPFTHLHSSNQFPGSLNPESEVTFPHSLTSYPDPSLQSYQSLPHPSFWNDLGNLYYKQNELSTAEQYYIEALKIDPSYSPALCNLASIYKLQGNLTLALSYSQAAMNVEPTFFDAYAHAGDILLQLGRSMESIDFYKRGLEINPAAYIMWNNLGNAYKDIGDFHSAILCYDTSFKLSNSCAEAFANLVYTKMIICDWEHRDENFKTLAGLIAVQFSKGELPSIQPFHTFIYPLDPLDKCVISQEYAKHALEKAKPYPLLVLKPFQNNRIRIGYVSSDFGNHPLSHLMQSVFGFHDRDNFEVFCFALSGSDNSEYRDKIMREADLFLDLSSVYDFYEAAKVIYNYDIDILVNLNGYTKGARTEIFACKPARLQVAYMGFAGTHGASYIPYLISDKVATPPEALEYYTEKMIWMPHSYYVNDYMQSMPFIIQGLRTTRAEHGLPEDKFIFANFNQLSKIDPDIFDIWCDILKAVPNSVLWLLKFPTAGENNLKSYAQKKQIDPNRIIFTPLAPKNVHVMRCALADLNLDTPFANGHTTGCDVLWSGCPMITLPLKDMHSRVGASLCKALECPEMIAQSHSDYIQKAIEWATGPNNLESNKLLPDHISHRFGSTALKKLRYKIEQKRCTAPLFNTKQWVRDLEKGLTMALKLEVLENKYAHIDVSTIN